MKKIDRELAKLGPRGKFERKNRVAEFYRLTKKGWVRELYGWTYDKGKVTSFLIGKQQEGGKLKIRNVEYVYGAGYFVRMPEERSTRRYYGYGYPYGIWKWNEVESFNMSCVYRLWDIEDMRKKDPKIKYLKVNDENRLIDDISTIKRYPQSESLFKMGLDRLARQERMYHLSKDMTRCVINIIKNEPEEAKRNQNLNMIIHCVTEGTTLAKLREKGEKGRERLKSYLDSQGCYDGRMYSDYIAMCRTNRIDLSKDINRYPRDLRKSHDALIDIKNKADKAKWDRKIKSVLKNAWMETVIGKYTFRLPTCFDDFRDQAAELGNCLINNEYYKRHADGKDIIVFVLMGDRRVGTIEVRKGNPALHQFTGNQRNKSWKPDPMLAKAGEEWRDTIWKPRCGNSNQSMMA